jgi:hypothetical protein
MGGGGTLPPDGLGFAHALPNQIKGGSRKGVALFFSDRPTQRGAIVEKGMNLFTNGKPQRHATDVISGTARQAVKSPMDTEVNAAD